MSMPVSHLAELGPKLETKYFVSGGPFEIYARWVAMAQALDKEGKEGCDVQFERNAYMDEILQSKNNAGICTFVIERITEVFAFFPKAKVKGPFGDQMEEIQAMAGDTETAFVSVEVIKGLEVSITNDGALALLHGNHELDAVKGGHLKFDKDKRTKFFVVSLDKGGFAGGQEEKIERAEELVKKLGQIKSESKNRADIVKAISSRDPLFFSNLPLFAMKSEAVDVDEGATFSNLSKNEQDVELTEYVKVSSELAQHQPIISSDILRQQVLREQKQVDLDKIVIETTRKQTVTTHMGFGFNQEVPRNDNAYEGDTLLVHDEPGKICGVGTRFRAIVPFKKLKYNKDALEDLIKEVRLVMENDPQVKIFYDNRYGQLIIVGRQKDRKSTVLLKFLKDGWLTTLNILQMIRKAMQIELFWCLLSNYGKKRTLNTRLNKCVQSFGQRAPVFLQVTKKLISIAEKKRKDQLFSPGKGAAHKDLEYFKAMNEAGSTNEVESCGQFNMDMFSEGKDEETYPPLPSDPYDDNFSSSMDSSWGNSNDTGRGIKRNGVGEDT